MEHSEKEKTPTYLNPAFYLLDLLKYCWQHGEWWFKFSNTDTVLCRSFVLFQIIQQFL